MSAATVLLLKEALDETLIIVVFRTKKEIWITTFETHKERFSKMQIFYANFFKKSVVAG